MAGSSLPPILDLRVGALHEPISGRRWSPADVGAAVAARALRLQREGLKPGGRVLLTFGNRLEFFAELLAVWQLGGCAIPIDARLTPFETANLTRAAEAAFAIVDDDTDASVSEAAAGAGAQVLHTGDVETGSAAPEAAGVAGSRLDEDALILFTSGSTGEPKGVVHTHRSLRARWVTLRQSLGVDAYERTLCLLPTHFGHGLICNCLFPLLSGQELFLTPPFKPDVVMRLGSIIDDHAITFLSSVPSVWRIALKAAAPPKCGTLRRVHCGSAPLSTHLWKDVQGWSGIEQVWNAYGITETGSWAAGTSLDGLVPQDGLVGVPWGSVVAVVRSDGPPSAEDACGPDEPGRVWLQTPALMRGYFGRDDLTEQVVVNGWFRTGDIGVLDAGGLLTLKGRERDEINKGGMKIHPADVDAVAERFERTRDVCTFACEDRLYGENVAIAVVLDDPSEASVRGLHDWMKRHLSDAKLPVRWYLVDEIPRTSRGKVNRISVGSACADRKPLDLPAILRARGESAP
jgi:acyl-CoA synthetase (AMP-forming)/AMP-acid ligase II